MEGTTPQFAAVDWLIIVGYFAIMVGIGTLASRKQHNAASYFLGERSMPSWAVALSMLATALSAATFIGAPQIAFNGNLSYLITNLGGMIAAFIVAFYFVPPIYNAGTVTIYGYLGKRYGTPSMVAASVMFLLGRLLASGARLFMAGIGFALLLRGDTATGDLVLAVIVLGLIGTVYTVFGGVRAVIWTDTIQIGVVVFAALMSIYLLLDAIPVGLGEIFAVLREAPDGSKLKLVDTSLNVSNPYTVWGGIFGVAIVSVSTYGVDHDLAQRLMTAKSPVRGGGALIVSTLLGIPVVGLFMLIGLLLFVYYRCPELMGSAAPADIIDDTKRIYPQFLLNHMPTGLRGLAMAGLFAAAMSSFDSAINAMAGTATADIYAPIRALRKGQAFDPETAENEGLGVSRLMVAIMGALLIGFAILAIYMQEAGGQSLIDFALGVMAFALAPLLGVFSAAIFTRRGNNITAILALVVGILLVFLLQPYALPKWLDFTLGWPWVWVFVSPPCFVVCALGSSSRSATDC